MIKEKDILIRVDEELKNKIKEKAINMKNKIFITKEFKEEIEKDINTLRKLNSVYARGRVASFEIILDNSEVINPNPLTNEEIENTPSNRMFTYNDMMDIAGFMAAADNKRPIPHLKEEAEDYIKRKKSNPSLKEARELVLKWWNSLSPLRKTQICDTNTELIGSIRRWETLTGSEIEKIYLKENYNQTIKTDNILVELFNENDYKIETSIGFHGYRNIHTNKWIPVKEYNKIKEAKKYNRSLKELCAKNESLRNEGIELIKDVVGQSHDWSRENNDIHSISIIEKRFLDKFISENI